MNRNDLVKIISKEIGLPQSEISQCLNLLFEAIKDSLISGEKVTINKFGTFIPTEAKERIGRNINTGKQMIIAPKLSIKFKQTDLFNKKENKP